MNDLFIEGLHITALGLSVVFIGLSLLIVFLFVINLFSTTDSKQRRPEISRHVSPVGADQEKIEPDLAEEELVAAISACLAYMETGAGRIT
jgi:sodium pump decarboxylase gamma subunit